jgi:hypothetical protein
MIPEIKQFMMEIEVKESAKIEQVEQGKKNVDTSKYQPVLSQID